MILLAVASFAVVAVGTPAPVVIANNVGAVQSMQDLQMAHIAANVQVGGDFDAFLIRDLTAYFVARGITTPVVTYELLRDGPTQSGVAYPKYYVWAKGKHPVSTAAAADRRA